MAVFVSCPSAHFLKDSVASCGLRVILGEGRVSGASSMCPTSLRRSTRSRRSRRSRRSKREAFKAFDAFEAFEAFDAFEAFEAFEACETFEAFETDTLID